MANGCQGQQQQRPPAREMGQTGSITQKAYVDPLLHPFTTWTSSEMRMLYLRAMNELPETFALRIAEFEFLLGAGSLVSR